MLWCIYNAETFALCFDNVCILCICDTKSSFWCLSLNNCSGALHSTCKNNCINIYLSFNLRCCCYWELSSILIPYCLSCMFKINVYISVNVYCCHSLQFVLERIFIHLSWLITKDLCSYESFAFDLEKYFMISVCHSSKLFLQEFVNFCLYLSRKIFCHIKKCLAAK